MAKQLSFDEVYEKIMEDIDAAETLDALEMNTNGGNNQARVSKAALLMLKARVVMYKKDSSKYAEVAADMAEIINSHAFGLMSDFDSIWGN